MGPQLFVTADRSTLDSFTATREYVCSMTLSLYARNSVSIGKTDQSHAQKVSGVTTSIHFGISQPGTS